MSEGYEEQEKANEFQLIGCKKNKQRVNNSRKSTLNTLDEFDNDDEDNEDDDSYFLNFYSQKMKNQQTLSPIITKKASSSSFLNKASKKQQHVKKLDDLDDFESDESFIIKNNNDTSLETTHTKKQDLVLSSDKYIAMIGEQNAENLRIIENLTGARLVFPSTEPNLVRIYGKSQECVEFAYELVENLNGNSSNQVDLSSLLTNTNNNEITSEPLLKSNKNISQHLMVKSNNSNNNDKKKQVLKLDEPDTFDSMSESAVSVSSSSSESEIEDNNNRVGNKPLNFAQVVAQSKKPVKKQKKPKTSAKAKPTHPLKVVEPETLDTTLKSENPPTLPLPTLKLDASSIDIGHLIWAAAVAAAAATVANPITTNTITNPLSSFLFDSNNNNLNLNNHSSDHHLATNKDLQNVISTSISSVLGENISSCHLVQDILNNNNSNCNLSENVKVNKNSKPIGFERQEKLVQISTCSSSSTPSLTNNLNSLDLLNDDQCMIGASVGFSSLVDGFLMNSYTDNMNSGINMNDSASNKIDNNIYKLESDLLSLNIDDTKRKKCLRIFNHFF